MNEKGQLVDESGKIVELNGEPIEVTGAKRQEEVDEAFSREQRKHKEKLGEVTEKIKALEAQAGRTEQVQKLLDDMKAEKADLEQRLTNADQRAKDEVSTQMASITKRAEKAELALEEERKGRLRDQVATTILSKAGDQFNDPATDLVPNFLSVHKREPRRDPNTGKDIEGEFVDTFQVPIKNEKGEEVREYLPIDKALEAWAAGHPHHVRGSGPGGSGGGNYVNTSNMKRSEMSAADKASFVGKHGFDAYKGLPE
jgi:hypothetical protein